MNQLKCGLWKLWQQRVLEIIKQKNLQLIFSIELLLPDWIIKLSSVKLAKVLSCEEPFALIRRFYGLERLPNSFKQQMLFLENLIPQFSVVFF